MITPMRNDRLPDPELWQLVCQGDAKAFEMLVGRYQSLVSAVAYNVCGNVALSEDMLLWKSLEEIPEAYREPLIAWDVACGGGAAVAREYAVGGGAWARHANDDAARALLLSHPLMRGMQWYIAHVTWVTAAIVSLGLLMPCVCLPLMYRRDRSN